MKRRALLILAIGLALPALAQQRLPRIGVLNLLSADPELRVQAFLTGLRERGYVEGKTIAIEWRAADNKAERLRGLADDLVRLKVDVIFAVQPQAVEAARRASSKTPVVFAVGVDPVGQGWVKSLARPGGNVTGHSSMASDIFFKHFEILKAAMPKLSRVSVLLNPTNPGNALYRSGYEAAAKQFGVQIAFVDARTKEEIAPALAAVKSARAEMLIIQPDSYFIAERATIADAATRNRVPTLALQREHSFAGGTLSYGPNIREQFRRSAYYVERILKGAKPAELPVEQPTQLELVVNLKSAQAMGIKLPQSLLVRADEVIR